MAWHFARSPIGVLVRNKRCRARFPPSGKLTSQTYEAQQLLERYYGSSDNLVRAQQILNEVLTNNPDFVPAYIQGAGLKSVGLDADAEQYFLEADSILPLLPNMVLVKSASNLPRRSSSN